MSHNHGSAENADLSPAFRWAVALNAGYVAIELTAGLVTGSLALIADAAHNLTDVAGLLIAWGASVLATRPPSSRFTYGFGRATILAAFANAMAILIGVGAVLWEAVQRFSTPVEVPGLTILAVALVGIAINTGTALLFRKSRHGDLNAEGAFLHMAADAAVSVAVVVAAAGILLTGWVWLDPAVAILVSLIIAWTAFGLLRASLGLSFDSVPSLIDRLKVVEWLRIRPGVVDVHDLHIWPLSTTKTALTAHLVMPEGHPGDGFLDEVADALSHEFSIAHVTLQIELGDRDQCRLQPDEVV
ncbi:MAG: cation diffusion facilitator family transporter [Rhodospirillales bacterium]